MGLGGSGGGGSGGGSGGGPGGGLEQGLNSRDGGGILEVGPREAPKEIGWRSQASKR